MRFPRSTRRGAKRNASSRPCSKRCGGKGMLYFAYGSNMDWDQMKTRCPSACFVGVAVLRDHRLAFTRRSKKRACGVADAVPEEGAAVWGAVFEIADVDIGRLDDTEGYRP